MHHPSFVCCFLEPWISRFDETAEAASGWTHVPGPLSFNGERQPNFGAKTHYWRDFGADVSMTDWNIECFRVDSTTLDASFSLNMLSLYHKFTQLEQVFNMTGRWCGGWQWNSRIIPSCPSWIWDTIKHPCSLRFQPILVPPPFGVTKIPTAWELGRRRLKRLAEQAVGYAFFALLLCPGHHGPWLGSWMDGVFFCGGQFAISCSPILIFVVSYVILNMCIYQNV